MLDVRQEFQCSFETVMVSQVVCKSNIYRVSQKKVGSQKYVYCSEGHKNQANQILILCMFFSTLGHLV